MKAKKQTNKRNLLAPLEEKTDADKFMMMSIEALKMGQRLDSGRHYLMSTPNDKFSVENCLEAFGFTRDGLGDTDQLKYYEQTKT